MKLNRNKLNRNIVFSLSLAMLSLLGHIYMFIRMLTTFGRIYYCLVTFLYAIIIYYFRTVSTITIIAIGLTTVSFLRGVLRDVLAYRKVIAALKEMGDNPHIQQEKYPQ